MRDSAQPKTTKDAILDATDRLLSQSGYKKMTIDDLAREVGIGKGSVYLHFRSKEDIALSHIDRIIDRLCNRLHEIADSDATCERRLADMLVERVLFRFDSVQHYTENLNDMLAKIRPKLLKRRERYFQREAAIFKKVLDEGECQKIFRTGSTDEEALSLIVATNSLLPYSLTTHELGERSEIEKRARALSQLLLRGLLARQENQ
jgi:AcrR family transcriptional regulator